MEALDPATLNKVDEKGFVADDVRNAFFRKLRVKSENRSCFECTGRNPTWISLTYGVFLCLECSGEHRRKGVHISFVRSVELDHFTPEQMVQMAAGGNGKAWEYFKQHGMGKLSDSTRHIDFNSAVAKRYKAQVEKDTQLACEKYGVVGKAQAPPAPTSLEKSKSEPAEEDVIPPAPSDLNRGKSAPPVTAGGYPAAATNAPAAAPKASPPTINTAAAPLIHAVSVSSVVSSTKCVSPSGSTAPSSLLPKPSGFAAKQKAKEIDFDFDFDDLEKEAAKPPPAPIPKASSTGSAPAAAPTRSTASMPTPASRSSGATGAGDDVMSKYAGKKGISSADFFHQEEQESAHARMERESRYQKFAASGAISSAAFFGDPEDDKNSGGGGEGLDDLRAVAMQGKELARAGISRGAELLSSYLNKARG